MPDFLKKLCSLRGVSGDEGEVREYIKGEIEGYCDSVTEDALGNLIVFKKGCKTPVKKIMVCAHMDEVGVIITDITEDGFLKFSEVGGMDRRTVMGKRLVIGEGGVFGVIGNKATHLAKREERDKVPKLEDMYIDIGAPSRAAAEALVSPGDTGAFDTQYGEFGSGYIKARAIDDRAGCAVMLELIKSELPVDCHFAFTVQEEVGTRGALVAAAEIAPDIALIVETTTAADFPDVRADKKVCVLNGGVVIPFMDKGTIYDRELYSLIRGTAEANQIQWQTKTMIAGGNDASAVQQSGSGAKAAALAVPVRNLHTPVCVMSTSDFEAERELCALFLGAVGDQYGYIG